jgi:hypothetical protein
MKTIIFGMILIVFGATISPNILFSIGCFLIGIPLVVTTILDSFHEDSRLK